MVQVAVVAVVLLLFLLKRPLMNLKVFFYRTVVLCVSSSFEVSSSFLLFIRLPTGIRRPPGVDWVSLWLHQRLSSTAVSAAFSLWPVIRSLASSWIWLVLTLFYHFSCLCLLQSTALHSCRWCCPSFLIFSLQNLLLQDFCQVVVDSHSSLGIYVVRRVPPPAFLC